MSLRKIFAPKAENGVALRETMAEATRNRTVRPESVQERLIGGQQALVCLANYKEKSGDAIFDRTAYYVWVRTENTAVEFRVDNFNAIFRWRLDPVLATARIP